MIVVDAVTAGYSRLKQDVLRRLNREQRDTRQRDLEFTIFNMYWLFAICVILFGFAMSLVYIGRLGVTWSVEPTGETILLPLSSIILSFAPTLSLVFPTVVLWRLVYHRSMLQRELGYDVKVVPWWMIWLAAFLCSVASLLWIIGLFALLQSPQQ